ncbi:MAG: hypothetical protein QG555_1323, partial [Thermodesulfobacteriota bacterium]|nr:hypothetical protein [Thermodesulfobacteriota bacterium]
NEDEGLPHKLTRRTGRVLVTKSTNLDRALTILPCAGQGKAGRENHPCVRDVINYEITVPGWDS